MTEVWTTLLKDLEQTGLETLAELIASELASRRDAGAPKIENIRPGMPQAERDQAASEIARVLRER